MSSNHVLVSGGTGFIATHIIELLLKADYFVTATTRDANRAQRLYDIFPHYKNKVEFVSVPDFTVQNAFDSVLQACQFDYILHTASPLPLETTDLQKDIIDPGPAGVSSLFAAAHTHAGPRLKRIVLTGSAAAVLNPFLKEDSGRKHPFTEEDWNPVTAEIAVQSGNSGLAYLATKTLAEKAAWDFIKEKKPSFDLTVLQPVIVLGPVLTPLTRASDVEQGNRQQVYEFINGKRQTTDDPFAISYKHVDVRDVAQAHLLALNHPSAGGQRILLCSPDVMSPQTVVNSINKHYPQLQDRVASGDPSRVYPPGVNPVGIDGSKALKVFGPSFKYTPLETSVRDVVAQILENESQW